ncbi:MAG: chromosomal replication initiator protein DnaA [Bacteroidaceae bacterium]|nr:chromosomal replication initiator protein DnaA [Bacteroidaceae bacterium]
MSETELQKKWELCLDFIRDNVSKPVFETWFTVISPVSMIQGELTLQVPSAFVCEYLEQNCLGVIKSALTKIFGAGTKLVYEIVTDKKHGLSRSESSQGLDSTAIKSVQHIDNKAPKESDAPLVQDLDPNLDSNYRFENFVEGCSNRLARTAAESIALNPAGTAFNPLFLYGASGVGKTHLVNAIGMKVRELHPELRVLYISAHLFMVQYVDSVKNNSTNDFIHFYQTIDVLIIDDMQEMAGQPKTQNTFFHIFNHLHLNHKQIIMTSDRSPKDMKDLEERLVTRFKWGLVAELERPDAKLRIDILKEKTRRDGLNFPMPVIDYLANAITDNVRDLEGAIVSIMAHSTIYGRDIDINLARAVLERTQMFERKPITIDDIISKVCEYYSVSPESIQSKSRKHEIVQARQISMFLANKYLDYSTSKIGAYIGKRDHATVLHAFGMVRDQIQIDKNFKADIENIESSLRC